MRRAIVGPAVVLALWLSSDALRAADTWVEARSQNFVVLSNAGEGKARSFAWQFEQVRSAMRAAWPWAQVTVPQPIEIIAVKNEDSMRALVPQYFEGATNIKPASVWSNAPDRYLVATRADVEVETQTLNPYSQAYWSYCSLILTQSFHRGLPLWLQRGLSGVLSNTIVTAKEVQFGRPLPRYAAILQSRGLMAIPQLLAVAPGGYAQLSADNRDQVDAESWALVQFLMFGDAQKRLQPITEAILDGATSEAAISKSFGSVTALDDAYRLYVHQNIYKFGRLQVNAEISADKYPVRPVSEAESAARRADFHLAMGRLTEARTLVDEAKAADKSLAAPFDVEALLFERQNNREAATAAFQRAIDLKSTSYYTFYRMAAQQTAAGGDHARTYLEQAIALNDQYIPAYTALANLILTTDPSHALEVMVKAVTLDPSNVSSRVQLVNMLMRLSRWDEAAKMARDLLPYAETDMQRQQLQNMADTATRLSAGAPPARAGAPAR